MKINSGFVATVILSTSLFFQMSALFAQATVDDDTKLIGPLKHISVAVNGDPADGQAFGAKLSQDGRFATFYSSSTNIVTNDTNFWTDVFVRDLTTNTAELISILPNGTVADCDSFHPDISNDGRIVVFESCAWSSAWNIYAKDRANNSLEKISVGLNGEDANGWSFVPQVSGDGDWVVFHSQASNLVRGDTNGVTDIFLYRRSTKKMRRISVDPVFGQGNNDSIWPSISADGRFIAYKTLATNLNAQNRTGYIVYDRINNTNTWASPTTDGLDPNGSLSHPATISDNGRFMAFGSDATNLSPGDTNNVKDVFLYDFYKATLDMVSLTSDGQLSNGVSDSASISGQGQYLVFMSSATNFFPNDQNGANDVFVKDLTTGEVKLVSQLENGEQPDSSSDSPNISSDGKTIIFSSDMRNFSDSCCSNDHLYTIGNRLR